MFRTLVDQNESFGPHFPERSGRQFGLVTTPPPAILERTRSSFLGPKSRPCEIPSRSPFLGAFEGFALIRRRERRRRRRRRPRRRKRIWDVFFAISISLEPGPETMLGRTAVTKQYYRIPGGGLEELRRRFGGGLGEGGQHLHIFILVLCLKLNQGGRM